MSPVALLAGWGFRDVSSWNIWRVLLRGCPDWMRRGVYGLTAYALLNYLHFVLATDGVAHVPRLVELQGFSGHWMIFYGGAYAAYSLLQEVTPTDGVP